MPNMITRCPKCATAFRISDTLLGTAKGMVRCGSCLNVFNALEHLESKTPHPLSTGNLKSTISPPARAAATEISSPTTATRFGGATQTTSIPNTSTKETAPPKSYSLNSNAVAEIARAPSSPISISGFLKQQDASRDYANEETPSSLFERPWAGQPNKLKKKEELDSEADESWALELLKEDEIEVEQNPPPKPKTVDAPPTQKIDAAASATAKESIKTSEKIEGEATLAPGPKMVEKLKPAKETPATQTIHTAQSIEKPEAGSVDQQSSFYKKEPFGEDDLSLTPLKTAQESIDEINVSSDLKDEPSTLPTWENTPSLPESYDASDDEHITDEEYSTDSGAALRNVIAAIEPEPLELEWKPKASLSRRLLWPSLALAALLLLLAQVAWLEFPRLNRVEPYRSFYSIVCQTLPCTLPELIDRSKIQTYNLVVRSHPEAANALIMDVILQNNATFEQTFPVLLVTFSNLENETVASRKLTPSEYLGGEMAGVEKMPIKQPIHIAIEIVDPGADVPNYSITITD